MINNYELMGLEKREKLIAIHGCANCFCLLVP